MLTFMHAVALTIIQIWDLPHSLHVGDSVHNTTTYADCIVHMNPPKCVTMIRVVQPVVPIRNTHHRNPQVKISIESQEGVVCCISTCVKETVQALCTGDPYLRLMFSHKFNRPLCWVQLFTTRVVSCEQRHNNTRDSALQGEVPAVGFALQDASHLVARRVTGKRELLVWQRLGGSTSDIVTNPPVLSHVQTISNNYFRIYYPRS